MKQNPGEVMVDKTLTPSPWATHVDYPKKDNVAQVSRLGLGNWVNQLSGQFSWYNDPKWNLIHSVS